MLLYKSKFFELIYHQDQSVFESRWLNSEMLCDEDFKENMLKYAQFAQELQPKNYLVDNSNMLFTIHPELQIWIIENIYPKLAHPQAQKTAIILSHDIFASLSVEQTIDEGGQAQYRKDICAYFDTLEQAWHWVNS